MDGSTTTKAVNLIRQIAFELRGQQERFVRMSNKATPPMEDFLHEEAGRLEDIISAVKNIVNFLPPVKQ